MIISVMQRIGRIRRLKAGAEAEYERFHRAVWPEVLAAIQRAGIRRYTIFRHGEWLFSYFELPEGMSLDSVGKALAEDEACRRWEVLMDQLVDRSSCESEDWQLMREVFHVDDTTADLR